jgi:hypothetical protein
MHGASGRAISIPARGTAFATRTEAAAAVTIPEATFTRGPSALTTRTETTLAIAIARRRIATWTISLATCIRIAIEIRAIQPKRPLSKVPLGRLI